MEEEVVEEDKEEGEVVDVENIKYWKRLKEIKKKEKNLAKELNKENNKDFN